MGRGWERGRWEEEEAEEALMGDEGREGGGVGEKGGVIVRGFRFQIMNESPRFCNSISSFDPSPPKSPCSVVYQRTGPGGLFFSLPFLSLPPGTIGVRAGGSFALSLSLPLSISSFSFPFSFFLSLFLFLLLHNFSHLCDCVSKRNFV